MSEHPPIRWRLFVRIASALLLAVVVVVELRSPATMHASDYLMDYYTAGRLLSAGRHSDLYPGSATTTFIGAPFDLAAHELFPSLSRDDVAMFMYPPLVAAILAPLAALPPLPSLLCWQFLNLVALRWSAKCYEEVLDGEWRQFAWASLLYFPVLHTILIGQLGLVLGLAPFALGTRELMRGHPVRAGLAWSILILKPQFAVAAGLAVVGLAAAGSIGTFAGFAAGGIGLATLSVVTLSLDTNLRWIHSLTVGDSLFASAQYVIPDWLVISLPASTLMMLPMTLRGWARIPIYAVAGIVAIDAVRRLRNAVIRSPSAGFATAAGALAAMPIVLPHLLFYDLVALLPAGWLLTRNGDATGRRTAGVIWIACNIYFLVFVFGGPDQVHPMTISLLLLLGYLALLRANPVATNG